MVCSKRGGFSRRTYRVLPARSRLHAKSPGDPIASKPSVAGSGVGMVRAAFGSSTPMSSGPLVWPVKINLLGIVS